MRNFYNNNYKKSTLLPPKITQKPNALFPVDDTANRVHEYDGR
jgi:hypothetical protein